MTDLQIIRELEKLYDSLSSKKNRNKKTYSVTKINVLSNKSLSGILTLEINKTSKEASLNIR